MELNHYSFKYPPPLEGVVPVPQSPPSPGGNGTGWFCTFSGFINKQCQRINITHSIHKPVYPVIKFNFRLRKENVVKDKIRKCEGPCVIRKYGEKLLDLLTKPPNIDNKVLGTDR